MREDFSKKLVQFAQNDPNVILLTGDHGYALFDDFRKACPNQYINAGIAEQNMMGVAAGLARIGFRPFVYGLAAFIPIRTLEQIKIDIAHDNLPVVILGDGAGFVYSHLGTSHQSNEDIACIRGIPNIQILSPADRFEMQCCMDFAFSVNSPVYLRIGKSDKGDVHQRSINKFEAGHLIKILHGSSSKIGLIATGSMVSSALEVGKKKSLSVWSAPMIKPLSVTDICSAARETSGLVTIEEHSVFGGLGSAVSEIISQVPVTRVLRLGVLDKFSDVVGSHNYLLKHHGLDIETILNRIEEFENVL